MFKTTANQPLALQLLRFIYFKKTYFCSLSIFSSDRYFFCFSFLFCYFIIWVKEKYCSSSTWYGFYSNWNKFAWSENLAKRSRRKKNDIVSACFSSFSESPIFRIFHSRGQQIENIHSFLPSLSFPDFLISSFGPTRIIKSAVIY